MTLNHSEIKQLIANNHYEKALEELRFFAFQVAPEYHNEVTTHQSKLNALKKDNRIGILSRDEYNRDIAKLTDAILELVDNLTNVDTIGEVKKFPNPQFNDDEFDKNELYEKVIKLYPRGIQDNRIWERSGGDISYFSLNHSPKEQWWDALQKLANGGGGENISLNRLIAEISSDYPSLI